MIQKHDSWNLQTGEVRVTICIILRGSQITRVLYQFQYSENSLTSTFYRLCARAWRKENIIYTLQSFPDENFMNTNKN
ncbi:hypothetical protein KIN20_005745 [Parelaphostrongylus tenuis]|uniref:Uncharacterized protein n=1 Tax=Parelaphostrongylus tenuis TaxID=148309 RepID=A0AAD5MT66_PARTN|nr:hypothetical protein KIN20_005745 [Parelaphostrongylus tenuis]